ncbi:HNH endonuclease family protein [Piscinibacter terrae]|uniref:HNH endonuclease n=1 Tax=Piscinibacter terrae TaxID=2496871 RepID=A0A3N7HTB1_9BURK|nr:HNH endonuclease [Albitalea terrae]RQP25540.1 HNH endonuclease [Albitalea terrae]
MVVKRRLRNAPAWHVEPEAPGTCPLCGRELVLGESVDEHHLVPKSQGGTVKEQMHRICHRKIHATFTEKELARSYHTWQSLREHPVMVDFIEWVKDKPPEFYRRNARSSAKR